MNFSQALESIKEGKLLTRTGWNGKNMFVYLVDGSQFKADFSPLEKIFGKDRDIKYKPHIDMRYADGACGVWLASHNDLLCDDWIIFEGEI